MSNNKKIPTKEQKKIPIKEQKKNPKILPRECCESRCRNVNIVEIMISLCNVCLFILCLCYKCMYVCFF